MLYVSVIPSIKMPYGHEFFDYGLTQGTAHIGDLILVPFRNKLVPALVAKISPTSLYAEKTININNPQKIAKFPEMVPEVCIKSAQESMVSAPTMLNAWLRNVPKRIKTTEAHVPPRSVNWPKDKLQHEEKYLVNRYTDKQGIIQTALSEQSNGRILIITPWQQRVEYLQTKLGCAGLTAKIAAGQAWKIWNDFLNNPHGILVVTRLGSWLSSCSDIVIIDEPENDDYKQDELTPRYDARRIIEIASEINIGLRTIKIGTTPALKSLINDTLPDNQSIEPEIQFESFTPNSRSSINSITATTYNEIEQAASENKNIRILHPVGGSRGRVRCHDCNWVMACSRCDTGMNNHVDYALCKKCNAKFPMPTACPNCQGANFSKSIIGSQELQKQLTKTFPTANIKVLDLHEWLNQSMPAKSLIIITELSFLSGWVEDIRKKERLVIAFRRIAAQAVSTQSKLIVQGNEALLDQAYNWLNPKGLLNTWRTEFNERAIFKFPPAVNLIKLITINNKLDIVNIIKDKLPNQSWQVSGPFVVENQIKTREFRLIYHILPPTNLNSEQIIKSVTPLLKFGILDLDPVAFFC